MNVEHSSIDVREVDEWYEQEAQTPAEESPSPPDPAVKYAKSQLRVVRETKDYQLDYLRHALQPGRELIDVSPAYQRRLRWANRKRSLLIESLLLNIPVPSIYLYERDYNAYEVIDGRQRLEAISSFLANGFALTGLEYWPELNRKRFTELPTVLQRGLLRRSIPAVVLLAETGDAADDDLDVRRVLFDRLNTGGIQLNPQELRNALYPGELNALLVQLARSETFTRVWGIPPYTSGEEDKPSDELLRNPLFSTLADAELVLRFFALRDAIDNDRKGALRLILDKYMANNANTAPRTLAAMGQEFNSTLDRLVEVFGDSAFRLPTTGRLSRPVYDALMIALSRNSTLDVESNASAVRKALNQAFASSDEYEILVGRGNTIRAVHERVALATQILSSDG